jgi:hypothetical protein
MEIIDGSLFAVLSTEKVRKPMQTPLELFVGDAFIQESSAALRASLNEPAVRSGDIKLHPQTSLAAFSAEGGDDRFLQRDKCPHLFEEISENEFFIVHGASLSKGTFHLKSECLNLAKNVVSVNPCMKNAPRSVGRRFFWEATT